MGIALVVIGLVGIVLPALPGAMLILAGLIVAAWADGFTRVGVWTLVVIGVIGAASYLVDFVAAALGAKKLGASPRAMIGAGLGTLAGLFFGLPGIIVGPFVGAVIGELTVHRDLAKAGKAGWRRGLASLIGTAVKVGSRLPDDRHLSRRARVLIEPHYARNHWSLLGVGASSPVLSAACRNAGPDDRHQPARDVHDARARSGSRRSVGGRVGPRSAALGHGTHEAVASSASIRQTARGAWLVTMPEVNTTFTQDGLLGLALPRRLAAQHRQRLRLRRVHLRRCPGAGAGASPGDSTLSLRCEGTQTLVEPMDILTGLPTHTITSAADSPSVRDRKLYLTIGDQGSNFGANRCNANHAQDLPTAAQ